MIFGRSVGGFTRIFWGVLWVWLDEWSDTADTAGGPLEMEASRIQQIAVKLLAPEVLQSLRQSIGCKFGSPQKIEQIEK